MKKQGGRHGPDFYPVSLQRKNEFRIDIFIDSPNGYAARLYLFSNRLAKGADDSVKWLRGYTQKLGLNWGRDELSRLDLRADVSHPFSEFRQRLDKGRCVTGRLRKWKDNHDTTRYFGSSNNVLLRIYDKAAQLGENGRAITRVEFQLGRNWLRRQGVNSWSDADLSILWHSLTQRFRIVNKRPDGKHYDRCPTWHVWQMIQEPNDRSFSENRGRAN
jgi:hypothetical protein